jgi:hypothetical protein
MIFLTYHVDERDSITWHSNLQYSLDWRHSIHDIITYYIDDTSQILESIHLFKEARFKLKSCLIKQIIKRLHTILGTQLYNIDILNYNMHKYVETVKLLLEFELLYDIEIFFKKWNKSIYNCWIIAKVRV